MSLHAPPIKQTIEPFLMFCSHWWLLESSCRVLKPPGKTGNKSPQRESFVETMPSKGADSCLNGKNFWESPKGKWGRNSGTVPVNAMTQEFQTPEDSHSHVPNPVWGNRNQHVALMCFSISHSFSWYAAPRENPAHPSVCTKTWSIGENQSIHQSRFLISHWDLEGFVTAA
jgi:hypothetical protein